MSEHILIAGCGDVGTQLGLRLTQRGHRVWALRRHPNSLPDELIPVSCDLRQRVDPQQLPADIDRVVYLPTPGARDETAYRRTFVDGLGNLMSALNQRERPELRLLFVSSTSVYGQAGGEWVDEDSITEPSRFAGRVLLDAEALARRSTPHCTVLRFAGIYGPGRTRLIDRARSGEPCADTPVHYTNRIHRDDCAGTLAHVLMLDNPADTYVGVDDAPTPQHEVIDWLAQQLGKPETPRRARTDKRMTRGKRLRNTRLRSSGYEFQYPDFRAGYSAVLAGMADV